MNDDNFRAEITRPAARAKIDRWPLYCEETEAAVLGTILHYPEQVEQDFDRLGINRLSFHDLRHQVIYDAINVLRVKANCPTKFR